MPATLLTPSGEIASLGVGKETNFAVAAVPTLFQAYENWAAAPKRAPVPRTGVSKRIGQRYPAAGGFEGSAALDVESSPDTLGQLLAFALGGQSAPTHAIVNTTLSLAIVGSPPGVVPATPLSMANIFVGSVLTIDTAANLETVTVLSVTATTFTANFTKAHAGGGTVGIIQTSASTGYTSKLTMASPLPTFTVERAIYNVGTLATTFARDYVGCKIDTCTLTLDPKGGLKPKFSIVYASEFVQASPTTPAFSTKDIFTFENPQSLALYKGAAIGQAGQVAVLGWDVALANNIQKGYFSFGSGPTVYGFPEGQRKATGKLTLGFESSAQYLDFLGASTGPATVIPGVSISLLFVSWQTTDAGLGIPYAILITLPNCFLSQYADPGKPTGGLDQTFNYEAAESVPGASDDISIQLVNAAAAIY